jgi:hypothetical protein
MARRRAEQGKAKTAPARARSQRGKPGIVARDDLRERLAALELERNTLRAELERSEARVQALEKTQANVRDRIAWALDTLQNILEGKT